MSTAEVWLQRLERWQAGARQWGRLRAKDLAWQRDRRAFAPRVPQLLSGHEWVFLVGCNNSGTTLVHDVLAATGRFSCMPHEGQRYTSALRRAQKKGHERVWTEYLEELRLDESDSTADLPRLLYDWVCEMEQPLKPFVLEKTTANAVRMRWLQRAFPRSAFIGVVRNGYAVVEGIKRKGRKAVDRGARHWQLVNRIMLDDSQHVGRFLLLRYEEFVTSPQQSLARIAQFLGLPGEELAAAFARVDGAAGGPRAAIRDMNAVSLQRLSREELATITREAEPLLRQLGYAGARGVA